jgi:hypothetical protein
LIVKSTEGSPALVVRDACLSDLSFKARRTERVGVPHACESSAFVDLRLTVDPESALQR